MSTSPLKRRSSWIVMAALALALLVAGATRDRGPASQSERARSIGVTIKCPVCGGENVADAKASVAQAMREVIARELASGKTDDEVRAVIETQYPDTQLVPPKSGLASLVWVLPVVVFVIGGAALARAFRRWRVDDADLDDFPDEPAGDVAVDTEAVVEL
jgi:cytochrome c-type biogenesis protein CcmH